MLNRIFVLVIVLLLSACSLPDSSKDEASGDKAIAYIEAIRKGDYESAFSYCSDEFFRARDKEGWIEHFKYVKSLLGDLTKVKLKDKRIDDRLTGRFFMFQFANKYEKGLSKEIVTMIMKDGAGGEIKIFGHKIDSSKIPRLHLNTE